MPAAGMRVACAGVPALDMDRAVWFGHINVELADVLDMGGKAEGARVTLKFLAELGVAPWSG